MGMNKLQRQKQRHDILAAIEQEFVDEMVPAKLVTDRELQTEVLGVVMEDFAEEGLVSTGEFFFKPVQSDEEDIQLFCNVVTIMEELSQENLGELTTAVSVINSIVPIGCFAINHEAGSLIYRHNYEMLMDLSDDTLKASVDLCLTAALNTVTQFSYLLVEVNEGERKAQGVFDVLVP